MTETKITVNDIEYTLTVNDPEDAQEVMEAALEVAKQDYKLAAKIFRIYADGGLNWIELE